MKAQNIKIKFPVWQFLLQPVFDSSSKSILDPRRFWYFYQIQLLERCWKQECGSKGRNFN